MRAIERELRGVLELPAQDAQTVLMLEGVDGDEEVENDGSDSRAGRQSYTFDQTSKQMVINGPNRLFYVLGLP